MRCWMWKCILCTMFCSCNISSFFFLKKTIYPAQLGIVVIVQSLSHIQLFATPWTAACQASLSFTVSQSLLKLLSIESVIPCDHLVPFSSCPPSFLSSGSFPMSWLFTSGGQNIGAAASASVLTVNIQGWFPLGVTGLISLQLKCLSRVFSNTTVQKDQFFSAQPTLWSNSHIHTRLLEKTIALTRWTFVSKVTSLLFNTLSRFLTAFLPRSKHLNFMAAVTICSDFGAQEN